MNIIIQLFLFLSLFPPSLQAGSLISECATYSVEGIYSKEKDEVDKGKLAPVILLNPNTNSEIRFYLKNKNFQELLPEDLLNQAVKVEVTFQSACDFLCEGYLKNLVGKIDPLEVPRIFGYPPPRPLPGTIQKCEINSLERQIPGPGENPSP